MFRNISFYSILTALILLSACPDDNTDDRNLTPIPVSIEKLTDNEVRIQWTDSGNPKVEGYILSRKVGEEEWINNYDDIPCDVLDFIDTVKIISNTVISYRLRAYTLDDTSDFSDIIAYYGPETAPSNLTLKQIDSENILLKWNDNSVGEEYFRIGKKIGTGNWITEYKLIPENQTEYIDEAGSNSDSISYRISAVSGISSSLSISSNTLIISPLSLDNLYFGSDATFEIVTWNVQNFPRNNSETIINLARAIKSLDVDIVAMQEIESNTAFLTLIDSLKNYSGYRANSAYANLNVAYLYKPNSITVDSIYEIYQYEYSAFPRRPLILRGKWNNQPLTIINNHYKCCGDGIINYDDSSDEEYRRLRASELLVNYIQEHFADDRVIVVGDLNDEVTDYATNNVFSPFINLPDEFEIADMSIAEGSSVYWSYPTWPSHIDHIIITDELFGAFAQSSSEVLTLMIDNYFENGWNEYALIISDHRPVGLKLKL